MTSVGFEPTPMKTAALTQRLGPLGHEVTIGEFGNRTRDLVHAKHALYQLSYIPLMTTELILMINNHSTVFIAKPSHATHTNNEQAIHIFNLPLETSAYRYQSL